MTDNKSTPQPKKKLKLYVGVAVLIALVTYFQMIVWADIPEITGPAIQYDHLSSEETEPYLVSGKAPRKRGDIRAAEKWPDVRSCLVRSERNKDTPDLRKINWRKMRMDTDIEVCMFRIFTSLGTPEKAKLWYVEQGLLRVKIENYQASNQEITRVKAYNSPRADRRIYIPAVGIQALILMMFTHSESFRAIWGGAGQLISTVHEKTAT